MKLTVQQRKVFSQMIPEVWYVATHELGRNTLQQLSQMGLLEKKENGYKIQYRRKTQDELLKFLTPKQQ